MSTSDKIKSNDDGVCEVNGILQNMSTDDTDVVVCANCGKSEEESHKLKHCNACMMVKYCNRECQIAHRPQHKKECRKRAAEIHDEELFKEPPSQWGDCPICFLLLPTLNTGSKYQSCCGKRICSGCIHAPVFDNQGNKVDNQKCAFCRTPHPYTKEEIVEMQKKRMEKEDAETIYNIAFHHREGRYGFEQDYTKALELYHRAAELGEARAYGSIGVAYNNGEGVEIDMKKAYYYYELAAMRGNATARHNLGLYEEIAGNFDRALKHYMIALRSGYADSLEEIKELYSKGQATKDDYTKALRTYQSYLVEIKSSQRDKAAAAHEEYRYY